MMTLSVCGSKRQAGADLMKSTAGSYSFYSLCWEIFLSEAKQKHRFAVMARSSNLQKRFNHRDHHNLRLSDPRRQERDEENIKGKQQQFLFHFLPRAQPDEIITRSVIGSFHFLPSRGWDLPYCYPPSSTPAVMREYFPRVWKQIQALLFKSSLNQPNQLSLFSFSRVTIHSIRLLKVSARWIFPSFCPSCSCSLRLTGGSRVGCTEAPPPHFCVAFSWNSLLIQIQYCRFF